MILKVEPAAKYDGSFPNYHLPIEIGNFSLNSDGKFCNDDHQLKYLVLPKEMEGLQMDLKEGFSKFIYVKDHSDDYKYNILRWIVTHQEEIRRNFTDRLTSRISLDFVCFRGVLKQVCSTIYEKTEDWHILATKHKSTIYLVSIKVAEEGDSENENPAVEKYDREREMSTWGHKFEQYMTSDTMNSKSNTSVPVNENEKFYTLVKGKYGKYNLLFGCEVDSVDPAYFDVPGHDPTSLLRYVELKTSRKIESRKQHRNFLRYKLLQWYLQNFLAATPRVICGFRDDDGIVRELRTYNVRDFPKMAEGMWSAAACMNFGLRFLDFVKQVVVKDYTEVVYKFCWRPGSHITYEELHSPTEYQILPDWYIKDLTIS